MQVKGCCLDCKHVRDIVQGKDDYMNCAWEYKKPAVPPWQKLSAGIKIEPMSTSASEFPRNQPYINCPAWEPQEDKRGEDVSQRAFYASGSVDKQPGIGPWSFDNPEDYKKYLKEGLIEPEVVDEKTS